MLQFKKWQEMAMDMSSVDDPFNQELHKNLVNKKKKATVYHVTALRNFWSIIRDGFKFDISRKNYNNVTPGNYFTFDYDRLDAYAGMLIEKGEKPLIFVLELPLSMLERDPDDAEGWDKFAKSQALARKDVPSKYIRSVIYPADVYKETPIRKFIKEVQAGHIDGLEESPLEGKQRFSKASLPDIEEAVANYLMSLAQYTSFSDHVLDNGWWFRRIILTHLHKEDYHSYMNRNGEAWVKWLENILGEKNEENYYMNDREFKLPLYQVIRKYRA